jgi:hypothetical protein
MPATMRVGRAKAGRRDGVDTSTSGVFGHNRSGTTVRPCHASNFGDALAAAIRWLGIT